ncbi:MAG: hypothetical protein PHT37_05680 [Candidatus Cloacimonetes bacterium]|nr:hypothetical protein [Candidatus Cloacimonadota bacterium]MDD4277358.1 hypothetical protein [Candidatus Cloacimonadota bacterium]
MKRIQPYNPENFERIFIAVIALICAGLLIYLGIEGPLIKGNIVYRTHPTVYNQLIAQDAVNTFVIAPILILGAWGLLQRKRFGKYLLVLTPLFLLYYAISYGVGWEWMAPDYQGNNQLYFFHYLGVLISALLIMFYTLDAFPPRMKPRIKKKPLIIYSVIFTIFTSLFAMMWMKDIFTLFATGTTGGYDISPAAFWLVRFLDLGFSVPLAFISLYLLWLRPQSSFPVQMLLYGFFLSMSVVVNAMGLVMYLNNDPAADLKVNLVFLVLLLISITGYVFILKAYKKRKS